MPRRIGENDPIALFRQRALTFAELSLSSELDESLPFLELVPDLTEQLADFRLRLR